MHSQNLPGFAMENQLQPPGRVAPNLPARDLTIIRHTHLVRDIRVRELLFRLADEGYLRDRVNPVRIERRIGAGRQTEGESGGQAALLHRYRSEAGEADH